MTKLEPGQLFIGTKHQVMFVVLEVEEKEVKSMRLDTSFLKDSRYHAPKHFNVLIESEADFVSNKENYRCIGNIFEATVRVAQEYQNKGLFNAV
jgi:hypothetical protein